MSERITGVEGTKLDREFEDMEKRTDLFNELVDDLQLKTKEYLQPNPTVRAKMAAVKGISKLSGQAKVQNLCSMNDRIGHALSDSKNTLHSSPIYNKCPTQSAWVLALPQERAHQDDSNDTPQPMCEFQVSFPLLRIRINQDKP